MLGLEPRLDDIQRARHDPGNAPGGCCRQNLQPQPDLSTAHPLLGHLLFLLVERELQSGKGQVAEQRGLEARIQRRKALNPTYCAKGIGG